MTDNDIIKALECCFVNRSCKDCPLDENNEDASCTRIVKNEAAKLCLRQKAEVERLQKENKITREYLHDNGLEWDLLSYSKRKEHN